MAVGVGMTTWNWNGVEAENVTRRKLRNGGIVKAYGGAFEARMGPRGGVLERCAAEGYGRIWETEYRTIDEYVDSLFEKRS